MVGKTDVQNKMQKWLKATLSTRRRAGTKDRRPWDLFVRRTVRGMPRADHAAIDAVGLANPSCLKPYALLVVVPGDAELYRLPRLSQLSLSLTPAPGS